MSNIRKVMNYFQEYRVGIDHCELNTDAVRYAFIS